MDDKNIRNQYDSGENKTKRVWRDIGVGVLAFFLALLTVVVINI